MAILKANDDLPKEIDSLIHDGYIFKLNGIFRIDYSISSGTTTEKLIMATPCVPIAALRDAESTAYGDEDDRCVTYMMMAILPINGGQYRTIKFRTTAETLADPRKAILLARLGISITSVDHKATYAVAMWQTILNQNRGRMTELLTINHLGWTTENMFAGIDTGITPSSDGTVREIMKAMEPQGDYNVWKTMAKEAIMNPEVRLAVDASVASPILEKIKVDGCIVHCCGRTGVGKTVTQMLAVSIWGDPDKSSILMQTMDSTLFSCETFADKLKNLPMVCDEGQLINAGKQKRDFISMIYKLAEGKSKARGQKDGGLRPQLTWRLIVISSGEHPLTTDEAPDGAKNRVINLPFPGLEERLPCAKVSSICRGNFGWAGRDVIAYLQDEDNIKKLKKMYAETEEELEKGSTGKQSVNGSTLLLGDFILSEILEIPPLTVSDIKPYLIDKTDLDENLANYEILVSMIQSDQGFYFSSDTNENDILRRKHVATYGMIEEKDGRIVAYIRKAKFKQIYCDKIGIDDRLGFLRWLKGKGLLITQDSRTPYETRKKIYDDKPRTQSNCIGVILADVNENGFIELDNNENDDPWDEEEPF